MDNKNKILEIAAAISEVKVALKYLKTVGSQIPAVEKNVLRMEGTLNALSIQFDNISILEKK
jgi:hypothetical protein